jgi:hypothetical protein
MTVPRYGSRSSNSRPELTHSPPMYCWYSRTNPPALGPLCRAGKPGPWSEVTLRLHRPHSTTLYSGYNLADAGPRPRKRTMSRGTCERVSRRWIGTWRALGTWPPRCARAR